MRWPFKRAPEAASHHDPRALSDLFARAAEAPKAGIQKRGVLEFVLVQVKDDDASLLPERLKSVIELVLETRGAIISVCGSIVFASFGFPFGEPEEGPHCRTRCVEAIATRLGDSARVLHGATETTVGLVGTPEYQIYGPIMNDFSDKIRTLLALNFGDRKQA